MSTDLIMHRRANALTAVDEHGFEVLGRVPARRDLHVSIRTSKNGKQMRFAWALFGKIAEASDHIADREHARDILSILAGHVEHGFNEFTNHAFIKPKSLADLDAVQFSTLLDTMVRKVCDTILPGLKESELRREIEAMVDPMRRYG